MATTLEKRWDGLDQRVGRNLDVPLALALIGVLFTIIVPLPPLLLDCLLVLNITLSVLILLSAIYAAQPLELSAFPSLLLMTTFFRLGLNIATTRLILGEGGEQGTRAAGRVVEAFGGFVAGSSAVVGFVIFMILVVVQFVVITRGAGRISEVAARFTLDAMPGKQLSIDAELNAGTIGEDEARQRRRRIGQEADFYGSMDGASKFIRGDAVASLLIILVNIVGGLILGCAHHGMSLSEAAEVFTRLTIGDGLVTQVPALLVSLGAGLLITRGSREASLGGDLLEQVAGRPRALYLAAVFLLVLLPSGLPPVLLLAGAAACGGTGLMIDRSRTAAARAWMAAPEMGPEMGTEMGTEERSPSQPPAERARGLLAVELLEVEIGYGLIPLLDESRPGNLLSALGTVREELARELGLVVPPVRVRDSLERGPDEYAIKIRGARVGGWKVPPGRALAVGSGPLPAPGSAAGADPGTLRGERTIEPASGLAAFWIEDAERDRAEALGYRVLSPVRAICGHLGEVLREHAAELLTREEVAALLKGLKERAPALVGEVVPEVVKPWEVQRVLQGLLRERVAIRDLETILETLGELAPRTRDLEVLTGYVRQALARSIGEACRSSDGKIHAVTLDPLLEELIASSVEPAPDSAGESSLALSPEAAAGIVEGIVRRLEPLLAQGHPPVVLCAPEGRRALRRLLEQRAPRAAVLSYNEVLKEAPLELHGTVEGPVNGRVHGE